MSTPPRRPKLTWHGDPGTPHGFPLAAVVRLPTGAALATVEAIGRGATRSYLGRIDGAEVTGLLGSAAACRREVAAVVERAHAAAARRHADAQA